MLQLAKAESNNNKKRPEKKKDSHRVPKAKNRISPSANLLRDSVSELPGERGMPGWDWIGFRIVWAWIGLDLGLSG